jgi:alpha-glucosidase
MVRPIPDIDEPSRLEGAEVSRKLVELKSGDWFLKVVPWIGGRIISMTHLPSGMLLSFCMMHDLILVL